MSLSASMWTSVSGLLAHGQKMNVVGNNIANVSTVAFKGQRMDFADFVYQNSHSTAGTSQIGVGVQTGAIMGNFTQGAFESSSETTDLAISGRGFFQVQPVGSDEAFYTRAGNFRFNQDGYLQDPNHYAVQGWRIDNNGGVTQAAGGMNVGAGSASTSAILGSGVPTDIRLDTWTVFPQQTTKTDFIVNLPKDGVDNAKNTTNPFAALFNVWDGTQPPKAANTPPIAQTSYAKQTTMQIFDEAGVKHTISVYFDKVSPEDYEGGNGGEEIWEYVVTMDPTEDKRQFMDTSDPDPANHVLRNVNETSAGGMLMSGTMSFNAEGGLTNQTSYTWGGSQNPDKNPGSFADVDDPAGGLAQKQVINLDPTNMKNWQPAPISSNGYPLMVPNFSGIMDANISGSTNGEKYNVEMNFGLRASNLSVPWQSTGSLADLDVDAYVFNIAYKGNDPSTGPEFILVNSGDPNAIPPRPGYSATEEDMWNPLTQKYEMGGASLWTDMGTHATNPLYQHIAGQFSYESGTALGNTEADFANYSKMLEYNGVDTVVIKAGKGGVAGTNIPSEDVIVNLRTGVITDIDGNVADTTATPADLANFGFEVGEFIVPGDSTSGYTPASIAAQTALGTAVTTAMEAVGTPRGLNLISKATPSSANDLAEFTEPVIIEAHASTNMNGPFASTPKQNGYGFGDLVSWDVNQDGVLSGVYSNGVTLPLWQLTIYDFNSTQGLRREGGNLFSQTRDSGDAKSGPAGTAGLGNINSKKLEQSNVDLSTEFVYMITTQRGFQANSKGITTVDSMLETVINMKR